MHTLTRDCRSNDPGILVDLNKYTAAPETYQPPGPAVWRG